MGKSISDKIIELFASEKGLTLRDAGVSERLNSDRYKVRKILHQLISNGILFRSRGYYQLNYSPN